MSSKRYTEGGRSGRNRVERTLIEDLIWAAVQAPTPPVSGDTPWAFCVIEGVRHLADYGARAKQYALDHQAGNPVELFESSGE